jgi:hypothetical protein
VPLYSFSLHLNSFVGSNELINEYASFASSGKKEIRKPSTFCVFESLYNVTPSLRTKSPSIVIATSEETKSLIPRYEISPGLKKPYEKKGKDELTSNLDLTFIFLPHFEQIFSIFSDNNITHNGLRAGDCSPVLRLRHGYGDCTLLEAFFILYFFYKS